MDNLDQSILDQLKGDARKSFAEIGRSVGLTAPAVAQRVQKMERQGPIKGYDVTLDYSKMGYDLKAFITVKLAIGNMPKFKKIISNWSEIQECHRVTGEDCLILKVLLRDNEHLIEIVDQLTTVGSTKTMIILTNMLE